jgi:hypothetical protein
MWLKWIYENVGIIGDRVGQLGEYGYVIAITWPNQKVGREQDGPKR